jgi:AcrR family transcriptional regulator
VIVFHARAQFARRGYADTSLRTIAEAAGVDHTLITYFFGSKRRLYAAATDLPIGPDHPALRAFLASADPAPRRLTRLFFALWSDAATAEALSAIIVEAAFQPDAVRAFGQFMCDYVTPALAGTAPTEALPLRLAHMRGYLASIALQRRFDPDGALAGLTVEEVVDLAEPVVRHILTAPMDGAAR